LTLVNSTILVPKKVDKNASLNVGFGQKYWLIKSVFLTLGEN
jgi:hypothetical protein